MLRIDPRTFMSAALAALLAACAAQQQAPAPVLPQPPVAALHPFDVQSPNGVRIDNYYWLRDDSRTRIEVLGYLKAENNYYAAMSAHYKGLEDTIYNEIIGRIKQGRFDRSGQIPKFLLLLALRRRKAISDLCATHQREQSRINSA